MHSSSCLEPEGVPAAVVVGPVAVILLTLYGRLSSRSPSMVQKIRACHISSKQGWVWQNPPGSDFPPVILHRNTGASLTFAFGAGERSCGPAGGQSHISASLTAPVVRNLHMPLGKTFLPECRAARTCAFLCSLEHCQRFDSFHVLIRCLKVRKTLAHFKCFFSL